MLINQPVTAPFDKLRVTKTTFYEFVNNTSQNSIPPGYIRNLLRQPCVNLASTRILSLLLCSKLSTFLCFGHFLGTFWAFHSKIYLNPLLPSPVILKTFFKTKSFNSLLAVLLETSLSLQYSLLVIFILSLT